MRHCKLSRSLSCSLSAQFGIAQAPSSKRYFPTNQQVATYCTTEWEAHVSCRSDVVNHSHNATDIYSLQCEAWVPGTRWYIDIDTLVGPIFPARIFRVSTSNWKEKCSHPVDVRNSEEDYNFIVFSISRGFETSIGGEFHICRQHELNTLYGNGDASGNAVQFPEANSWRATARFFTRSLS